MFKSAKIIKEKIILIYTFSGVGVPIMLAYVYGVVPLSLCRNGGCGGGGANGDAGSPAVHNDNSDSSPIDIDVEAAYGDEDTDDIDLLTNGILLLKLNKMVFTNFSIHRGSRAVKAIERITGRSGHERQLVKKEI